MLKLKKQVKLSF